ncbi:MAG: UMP kinase [Victivallales bacterium]|nr:UMP kinase [Victivallales bacterium]MCF7889081.1 UMP kinase [Victivallales bacterium]
MKSNFPYKRILLKISGEALSKPNEPGYCPDALKTLINNLINVLDAGIELALVIGAGNIWRGKLGKKIGMDPVRADYMGMLGTVMNGLMIKDCFEANGITCKIQTSQHIEPIAETFDHEKAVKYLEEGCVVIFAGGTGHPFFTTDTTAVLRALEIDAEAVLKATKVNGIFSADPETSPDAVRYEKITYEKALMQNLKIMDSTAFSLCKDNDLPIVVFNYSNPNNLIEVLNGNTNKASIVSN